MGYSLQSNRKISEGKQHPDRNEQFEFINLLVENNFERGNPVISVDAKKKELVGNFKNSGQKWHPKGSPEQVNVYDFLSMAEGRATPYRVYDIARNEGWVNVGADKDTSVFAVESIRRWWNKIEHRLFSFISMNWRGKPLTSFETIVNLIASTTTKSGLTVAADIELNEYPKGIKVSDAQMRMIDISRNEFHGEWNYTLRPQTTLDL